MSCRLLVLGIALWCAQLGLFALPAAFGTRDAAAKHWSIYELLCGKSPPEIQRIRVIGYLHVDGRNVMLAPSPEVIDMEDQSSVLFVEMDYDKLNCTLEDVQKLSGCYVVLEGVLSTAVNQHAFLHRMSTMKDVTRIEFRGRPNPVQ